MESTLAMPGAYFREARKWSRATGRTIFVKPRKWSVAGRIGRAARMGAGAAVG
jgi:hypothetical protein